MNDIAQLNLREPEQVDWNNVSGGSTYQPPPPALGPDGKPIVYFGVTKVATEKPNQYAVDEDGNPFLNFSLDPITLVDSGKHSGYVIRFTECSTKPFQKGKSNKLATFVDACGSQGKPQTNDQYRQVVKACLGKRFGFTVDWEARNSETGEKVKGYLNFPLDPDRPGERKAILKAGDVYTVRDNKGAIIDEKVVESEVLFANARLRFFVSQKAK